MKNTVFLVFLSLAAFLATGTAVSAQKTTGQTKITGRVIDSETAQGEPGAIIQFFADGDEKPFAFTSTDTEGNFNQLLPEGKTYKVSISNLGRKTIEKTFEATPGKAVDLGELLIEDDKNELAAAAVVAQRPLVKMEVDKMTYNVEDDADSKSYTVLDMLRKVPMVTVDAQDNISVNGSSSFLVTVDGKPNQMLTANASKVFKMMPAATVKRIEVVTNPGVKYDAEGVGGVLNLVTNVAATGGTSAADGHYGSVNLSAGTRNSNIGAMITAQKGKFSFSLNGNVGRQNNGKMSSEISTTEKKIPPLSLVSLTKGTGKSKTPFAWGDLSLSYEPDTLNLFSVNASAMYFSQNNTSLSKSFYGFVNYLQLDYSRDNESKDKMGDYNVGADWQHKFADAPEKTFTVSYRGGFNPNTLYDKSLITTVGVGSPVQSGMLTDGKTNSDSHTLQADYTTPWGPGSFSTGLKFTYRKNKSVQNLTIGQNGSMEFSPEGSTDYLYTNKIGAAYAEYGLNSGKFGLKAGGRYEYTWQDIEYRNVQGQDFSTKYGFFIPTASVQYNINMSQNIGLRYNVRISRPGISYLNPYVNMSDPSHTYFGNPDLDVSKNHGLSLVYNYYNPVVMLNATLSQNFTRDGISEYTYFDDVLVTTYGNILKSRNTNFSLFANLNLGRATRIYFNASLGYDDLRSSKLEIATSHWNSNLFAGAQQTIFWDLRLSENLILSPRQYNLQGWNSGFKVGVLSISKSFLDDKLTFTLTGVTPINGKKHIDFKMVSESKTYSTSTAIKIPLQQAMFSVAWNFGKAGSASVKKANRTVQNDDIMEKPSSNEGVQNGNIGM